MRGHGTAAAAHGNKRAVAALALQRAEALEALCGRTPPALVAAVDVTSRFGLRTGEAGTGVDRSVRPERVGMAAMNLARDRKSTRLNSSHLVISYAVFCLKKKKIYNR